MATIEFVYILRCADGTFYVGRAGDVARRVADHNAGLGANYTADRRPVQLVYTEPCSSSATAILRERQLKGWTRAKKEALIVGQLEQVHKLSRRRRM